MVNPEARVRVMKDSRAKKLWYANLVVQAIGILNLVYATIVGVQKYRALGNRIDAGIVIPIVAILFSVAILWGIYRFKRWVVIIMWIALAFSVISANGIGIVVSGFVLFSYRYVLKVAEGKAPEVSAPSTPNQPA